MKKAVLMAGGFGTRLRPLTMTIPKPMVPIVNIPIMEHVINLLKKYNIREIVALLYFQPEVITEYFKDGSKFGVNIKYVLATADYGTAGAVKNAYQYLDQRFIVISGDVLTDFNLQEAIDFHLSKNSLATILLTRVKVPLQYGIVITDKEGKIVRFLEKPSWGEVFSDTINTGIYILEPEVLELIPYQEEFDFSKDLFPLMLRNKMPLYGFVADGYWKDIGNLEEYQNGQIDALRGNVNVLFKGEKQGNVILGSNCSIAPNVKFKGKVVIGDNTIIEDFTELTDCVIGSNVRIGKGVRMKGVSIWDNVRIGSFSELTDDVICYDCTIGESVTIGENVFVSVGCTIGNNVTLAPNIKLWPLKHIEDGAKLSRSLVQEEKWQRELFTGARISGLSNTEIHPEFGSKLGMAIGMTFGKNSNVIASRDPDRVSRIIKRSITAGLASVGVNVNDLQTTSIPQTRQELRTGKYSGGIHVRRSPRNPDKTDIIIFSSDGRDIGLSKAKTIERYFFGEDIKRVHYSEVGQLYYPERTNEIYINRYLSSLDVDIIKSRRFKILMDYSYGLAATIFPIILGKLNAETLSLHDYVDAMKHQPMAEGTLIESPEACRIMKSLGYELGFIIEPGAEKILVINSRGVLYHPQRLLTIVTKLFLETNRTQKDYKIAVSIVASSEVEKVANEYGIEVVRIKNSHSAMMEATRDEKIKFVGGVWGSFIFTDFLFASDGMYSIGKILEMLAKTGYSMEQLDEMLPRRFQHTIKVDCPWENKGKVIRRALEFSEGYERQLVEGVKIFKNGDSVLLYPDLEKPEFLIIGESDDYETAVTLSKKFQTYVQTWMQEDF
ncbi:MAG: sugar phosphate nucleotidyltransferase [Ignavibacteria bacterium]|nr:sugar phosphate nucleotidyltransferase [Ignavibacteria bacterium]